MPTLLITCLNVVSTCLTIAMFTVPLRATREMSAAQSTLSYSPFPFAAMFVNCLLWTAYGVVADTHVIVGVNVVGGVTACYSLAVYGTLNKGTPYLRAVGVTCLCLVASFALLYTQRNEERFLDDLGILANAASIAMFAAPLAGARHVIATGNADAIPVVQVSVNTLTAASWTLLGVATANGYIVVPNTVGVFLGTVQLLLYVRYKSEPS